MAKGEIAPFAQCFQKLSDAKVLKEILWGKQLFTHLYLDLWIVYIGTTCIFVTMARPTIDHL